MDDRLSMGLYVNLLGMVDFWINKKPCGLSLSTFFPMSLQECIIKFARLVMQTEIFLSSWVTDSEGMVLSKDQEISRTVQLRTKRILLPSELNHLVSRYGDGCEPGLPLNQITKSGQLKVCAAPFQTYYQWKCELMPREFEISPSQPHHTTKLRKSGGGRGGEVLRPLVFGKTESASQHVFSPSLLLGPGPAVCVRLGWKLQLSIRQHGCIRTTLGEVAR